MGTAHVGNEPRRLARAVGAATRQPLRNLCSTDDRVATISLVSQKGNSVRRSALPSGPNEVGTAEYWPALLLVHGGMGEALQYGSILQR